MRVADDRLQLTDAAGRDVSSRAITLHVLTVDGAAVPSAQLAVRGGPSNGWYVLQHDRFVAKATHVVEFLAGDDPVVHRVTLRVK
jgi:hypothetical protein